MMERGNDYTSDGRRLSRSGSLPLKVLTSGLALLLAAGCGPGGDAADSASADAAAAVPTRHLGLFVAGDFIEFEACSGEPYSVDGPVLADLVSMREQLVPGLEPLEAVFIDVLGTTTGSGTSAALDAIELRRVAYEGGGCSRDDTGIFVRGQGTEPFWSVAIGEDGFTWTTPETTQRLAHNGLQDGPRGEWIFEGLDAQEEVVLTATLIQQPCVDQMSGSWFHLTIRVERGDDLYQGCAYLGPQMEGE